MKQQGGFTLIELIMVIVILGILAATALPKFIDLSEDAELAALEGVTGSIASAGAINYAAKKVNSSKGVSTSGEACEDIVPLILENSSLSGFTIGGNIPGCTVTNNAGTRSVTVPEV